MRLLSACLGLVKIPRTAVCLLLLACGLAPPAPGRAGKWQAAAPMNVAREYAGGVLLKNGKVLAVSGHPLGGKSIASAEVYDPETDRWELTGSLSQARNGGDGATLLLDGRVLIAGDHDNTAGAIAGAEIYDPGTESWTKTGALGTARGVHTTTRLLDGKVLVAGGIDWGTEKVFATAELYDPPSGAWSPTGSMTRPRFSHHAVLLTDGRVLALGGCEKYPGAGTTAVEIYEPEKGSWRSTRPLREERRGFAVAVLRDGRVLVAGGRRGAAGTAGKDVLSSAELYDPRSEEWEAAGPMAVPRAVATLTLLADGRVLVAGGISAKGLEVASAEIFDPARSTWIPAGSMATPRRNHRSTLLPDGSVLVLGGSNFFGGNYLKSTERFQPSPPAAPPKGGGERQRTLGVLIYPGFELLDARGPLEMWGNRKPLVDVALALNMTVAGIVARQSALKDGERLKIPQ